MRIPKKVSAGEISQLSLLAVDPNQDPLIFTWKIDDVVLEEGPKTEIEWQVPTQEGEVTIQVIVSDGIAPAVKRSNIVIVTRSLLIVPGLRAGGITLGDSFKTIKDIYGEPNIFEKVDDLFFFAFWQPDQGISGFIDEQTKTVTATFIQSPNQAKTAAGNGVNSTLNSVEKEFGLVKMKTYRDFFIKIRSIKYNLNKILNKIKRKNQSIHAYGASTKGNVLLQYFNIGNKQIDYVADRNPSKFNNYTPGTKIKIISEKMSRKISPNFYLVLPWHFKKEILNREKETMKKGSQFIFPLPNIKIYKKNS